MSKHEDSKYLCHQFYLHATKAGNLNLKVQGQGQINKKCQVKSKHEGIKYPWQECDPIYATLVLNDQMNFKER